MGKKNIIRKEWSEEDKSFLLKNFFSMSVVELSKKLSRSEFSIRGMAKRLGLRKQDAKYLEPPKASCQRWRECDKEMIRKHYYDMPISDLAKKIGRSEASVAAMACRMKMRPRAKWTKEEEEYMEDHWGSVSVPAIAARLNRSIDAVKVRATGLGLGSFLESGDGYITLQVLYKTLRGANNMDKSFISAAKKRGLSIKHKKVQKSKARIVYINDFWEWAEKNKDFANLSRLPKNIFGVEPEWADKQREIDRKNSEYSRRIPWTRADDQKLKDMLATKRFTVREISLSMKRTQAAIYARIKNLRIKDHPVPTKDKPWSEEELATLVEKYDAGYIADVISEDIDRSVYQIKKQLSRMGKIVSSIQSS